MLIILLNGGFFVAIVVSIIKQMLARIAKKRRGKSRTITAKKNISFDKSRTEEATFSYKKKTNPFMS